MTIAFLDVHYQNDQARAACVVAGSWQDDVPSASYVTDIPDVQAYQPGSFFRRELPCLVSVLRLLPSLPDILVIDGYVWLPPDGQRGLGARLYEALGQRVPVVGIAKTAYSHAQSCPGVALVFRGDSGNPLFITAVGIDLEAVAGCVRTMAGKHRIPTLLRITDQLSRGVSP